MTRATGVGRFRSSIITKGRDFPLQICRIGDCPLGRSRASAICRSVSGGGVGGRKTVTSHSGGQSRVRASSEYHAPVEQCVSAVGCPGLRSSGRMNCETHCSTGAWYSDEALTLDFPPEWDVTVFRPPTPPPLTDRQIAEALERPSGQSPIREICRGKSRPLVIIDDLNRPTPVARVMPFLLTHFHDAGISSRDVTILVATGTHGAPQLNGVLKKAGPEAASCKIVLHDPERGLVQVGSTTSGTIVLVNREVMQSDVIVGIGGIYPNHTAGFGGGSKLALGVLGFRSIMELHYRHQSNGWGDGERVSSFRSDLDEIARMIGLNTLISLQVNANREVIRMACGDHFIYYRKEVDFARRVFRAPLPGDANVVITGQRR